MKQRIIEAIRVLFSQNTILSVELTTIFKSTKNLNVFVQIGSNDGKKNDPLFDFVLKNKLTGILVEPNKSNFKKLTNNYNANLNPNLIFENLGIGISNEVLAFYQIRDIKEDEPDWYDQVGSFDKETFIKNIEVVPGLLERLSIENIQVITFDELLKKNNTSNLDLLHIDTEGYDYKILKSINFDKYNIKIVIFETEWMTQYELRDIIWYMRKFKYKVYKHGFDHVAIKNY